VQSREKTLVHRIPSCGLDSNRSRGHMILDMMSRIGFAGR